MAKSKIGRNDPCWCGSGTKYKKCHLDRDQQGAMSLNEILKAQSKALFGAETCLHPDAGPGACDGGIIKAHTVQRNSGLSRIAKDGHVYHFKPDLIAMVHNKGKLQMQKVGLMNASTFTGFCKKHDAQTFLPIETQPFTSTPEQCFLLGYRAVCMELYKKMAKPKSTSLLREMDKGRSLASQLAIQEYADLCSQGNEAGLKDTEHTKAAYDAVLASGDYAKIAHYTVEISQCPEFACSGVVTPEIDPEGSIIQDLADTSALADQLAFSVIPTDNGGVIAFSWIEDPKSPVERLVRAFHAMPDDDLVHSLVRFTFQMFENVFISMDWLDALSDPDQQTIVDMANDLHPVDLKDNGLRAVSWAVVKRSSSLAL